MKTLIIYDSEENFLRYFYGAVTSDPNVQCLGVTKNFNDLVNFQADGKRPDIYVVSLNVLGLDAQTIVTRIRAIAPNSTIVGFLQRDNSDVRAVAKQCGADEVFVKHSNFVEMTRAVMSVAQRKTEFQPIHQQETIPAVASFDDDFVRSFNPNYTQQQLDRSMYQQPQTQGQPQMPYGQQQPPMGYGQAGGSVNQGGAGGSWGAPPMQQEVYQAPNPQPTVNQPQGNDGGSTRSFVQKTVVVGGAKGGTGKTTVACELANSFALVRPSGSTERLRVCLVDLDLDYGDVSTALGLPKSPYNIYTWAKDIKERRKVTPLQQLRYSFNEVKLWLSRVEETGLYVLPAPFTPIQGSEIEYDEVHVIIDQLRAMFDILILDVGNNTKDYTIAAYEKSSDSILVVAPDLACIRDTHVMVQALREIDMDTSNFFAIANKIHGNSGNVQAKEIEKAVREKMGIKYIGALPKSDLVEKARNAQQILSASKNNEFTVQIRKIGNQVVPVFGKSINSSNQSNKGNKKSKQQASSNGGGFFNRLFGRG